MRRFINNISRKIVPCMLGLVLSVTAVGMTSYTNNVSAAGDVISGDLDGDGKVSLTDASIGLKVALGIPDSGIVNYEAADVFGNGTLSLQNVRIILQAALGLGTVEELISKPIPEKTYAPTPTPVVSGNEEAYAKQVLTLVNSERTKRGLSALSWDTSVAEAASVRAKEITEVFAHSRPDGRGWDTIFDDKNIGWMGCAENIAYGQQNPEEVVEAWMNSEGHRANILNGSYTKLGVGCYKNSNGLYYWVQLFIYN